MCQSKGERGSGFKDLKNFNMAMLAKQIWRIMKDKTSLLYRTYKAKYFANWQFMKPNLEKTPSYMWRGIWEVQFIIHEGCR